MDKRTTVEELAAMIPDGATIAIGGSALSRKPMALIRAMARRGLKDLTVIVDIGGPDVDLLLAVGAVRRLIFAFVGFEILGLAPHFRRARQAGAVAFEEWSEYTVMAGLDATIKRVPFMPTHAGLASDVLEVNPSWKTIADPFGGEALVAIPALKPDFSLIHVNYADPSGNGAILGDSHVDALMAKAASKTLISAERILPREELVRRARTVEILSIYTAAVAEVPWGAHPTGVAPSYRLDADHLQLYLEAGARPEAWNAYQEAFLQGDSAAYLEAVGGPRGLHARLAV